jgi:hypothetical protein
MAGDMLSDMVPESEVDNLSTLQSQYAEDEDIKSPGRMSYPLFNSFHSPSQPLLLRQKPSD